MKRGFRVFAFVCLLGAPIGAWAQNTLSVTVSSDSDTTIVTTIAAGEVRVRQASGSPTTFTVSDSTASPSRITVEAGSTYSFFGTGSAGYASGATVGTLRLVRGGPVAFQVTQLPRSSSLPSGATATTQSAGDNSTKIATTAYADAAAVASAANAPVPSSAYTFFLSSTSNCLTPTPSGSTVCARNNLTSAIDFSGSDATVVITSAINNISSTCGALFFKNGTYNFNSLNTESTGGYSLSYALGVPSSVSSGVYCEWQIIGESMGGVDYGVANGSQVNIVQGANGVMFNVTSTAVSSVSAGTFISALWVRPDVVSGIGPNVVGKNFLVRLPTNQRGNTAKWLLWNAVQTTLENVEGDYANLTTNAPFPVKGTIGQFGFTTTNGGKGWNNWKRVNTLGDDLSYDVQAEITNFESVSAQACNFAYYVGGGTDYSTLIQSPGTTYHPSIFVHGGWSECARGLTLGAKMAQGSRLDWPGLVIEENSSGSFAPVYRMSETNKNYSSGLFTYSIIAANVGVANVTENPSTQMWTAGGQGFQLLEGTAPINLVESIQSDSFTHPTVAPATGGLGPAWQSNFAGTNHCGIASNTAVSDATATVCLVSWAPQTFTNDQFSLATVSLMQSTNAADVIVRASPTANTQTYYAYECSTSGGATPKRAVSRTVAGSKSTLATTAANSGCTAGGGDVIELDAITLPNGNALLNAYYTVTGGAKVLDLSVVDATPITSGRPGIAVVDSSGTSPRISNWSGGGLPTKTGQDSIYGQAMFAPTYSTLTNCAGVGTAASPSVASCGSAAAGHFSCATNATGATCQVNTTAVTANSEIFVFESDTAVTGTALGVTCNTGTNVLPASRLLASSVTATSFTINLGTVTTNPACFSYEIVN
jgi:hypothetical protein